MINDTSKKKYMTFSGMSVKSMYVSGMLVLVIFSNDMGHVKYILINDI